MVLLAGLEIVAAGYLLKKHVKNKKERARLEEESLRLEEEQYHLFPPQGERHHQRSHSERRDPRERRDSKDRRDSRDRRNSYDRKDSRDSRDRKSRRDRDTTRPASTSPVPPYKAHSASPRPHIQSSQRPVQPQPYVQTIPQHVPRPPPQPIPQTFVHPVPQPQVQVQAQTHSYPPDIKYGWTDDQPSSSSSQEPGFPPTGWPAHWEQSRRPDPNSRPTSRSPYQTPNMSRTSTEIRPNESRVRFAVPQDSVQPGERRRSSSSRSRRRSSSSASPPPYRP
ncbi:hypothetical protein HYFRA_00001989 [Hymenoscyphus fraxineus]|uniref:Uncharacterized protein n=1 Tax=Hymenoscyphus fraxineus TaxID=746836 RepID=A0A9N9KL02_9HELO|nr:hypothetical protein HYFRA_00001989 [Hymenoscyphus fraxineus]